MGRKQKVFWTDAEKSAVVSSAIQIRTHHVPDGLLELFRLAQREALPESRRRKLRSVNEVPWFEEMLNSELRRRRESEEKSDPAMRVFREVMSVQQQFFNEILRELHQQSELLRKIAGGK
jgi:hypothetical protein